MSSSFVLPRRRVASRNLLRLREVRQALFSDGKLILRMRFVILASHGRYYRPPRPDGRSAWQGRWLRPPVASHLTRASRPWTCAGALPLRPSQRAFVLLGTMTGAFLPLDPDPRALPSGHPPRALVPFGNHASEPSCSDTMTGGLRLLRPPRAANRSPREGARPLKHAGATGTRRGMTGAVKARQEPASKLARSLS